MGSGREFWRTVANPDEEDDGSAPPVAVNKPTMDEEVGDDGLRGRGEVDLTSRFKRLDKSPTGSRANR